MSGHANDDTAPSLLTLKPLYTNALRKYRERVAVVHDGDTLTYGQLLQASCRVAHALIDAGVTANVRVGLLMSNCLAYAVADQAIIQSGGAKVPLNDMLGEKEIRYIVADSNARVLIVGPAFFDIVARNRGEWPELQTIVGVAPRDECPVGFVCWDDFAEGAADTPPDVLPAPDDLALIAYTGGTTGRPKGVMHTQQGTVLNLWSHVIEMELLDDERLLLSSPLPHSAGFLLLAGLLKGATHFVERGFDPATVVRRIENDRVTLTFMVPTMIYRLIDWIGSQTPDLSSLRTIIYGAAPITVPRLRQGLDLFGPVFMQLYGQSEAVNFITRLRRQDHRPDGDTAHRLASCGQPVAMSEVRIVDAQGDALPAGEIGELTARTPYTMRGYHGLPEKTAETLVHDWLHTGDIAYQDDDGYVYLLDRKNDMIISGGMNVYTKEVEDAIQSCPGVSQVAVVGLPHADWGEAVSAFIVAADGAQLTETQVLDHCRGELSRYKQPKNVQFVDALPVTAYGKLDKKALRLQAAPGENAP
ncbi:AMP-binding protein [Salinisphaera aquimarina]|uniref:AMP-binding protein n=1 Tax=Salinisphaera aquimarina TaxID=2094031 RepID=A0ABV7EME5_9GAMM